MWKIPGVRWVSLGLLMCLGCFSSAGPEQGSAGTDESVASSRADYESRPAVLFPGVFEEEARNNRAKPGHWVVGALRGVSNRFDANGEMHAFATDSAGLEIPVRATEFYADSRRPVALPKGQEKSLETLVYLPKRESDSARSVNVRFRILGPSGLPLIDSVQPVVALRPHQYHLVALVDEPDSYRYWQALDCIQIPSLGQTPAPPFYHLVFPDPGRAMPLGPSAMAWTTIAYVLWDGAEPDSLTPDQQQAMVDWLHFGGQIIISGPGNLPSLPTSFLGPYLPVQAVETVNLSSADLAELNANWSRLKESAPDAEQSLLDGDDAPLLGLRWQLQPDADDLPGTGGLVAERRVGRGRIVVTAFSLRDPRIKKWKPLSSLIHNALLRKPPRRFELSGLADLVVRWAEPRPDSLFSPLIGSTLRFVSRDLGGETNTRAWQVRDWTQPLAGASDPVAAETNEEKSNVFSGIEDDPWHYGGFGYDDQGGVGTWNDEFGIADAARKNISRVAGINPPDPKLVLQMLAVYLLILVPVNWAFFRLIGRVEWAWGAIPIIALIGALAVVRFASLDIGFVRSRSQIGVLELHGGFPRGHLTEFAALYTSLSTRYDVTLPNETGLALPLPTDPASRSTQVLSPVYVERGAAGRLRNFLVQSNSTKLLHQECVLDVMGSIELTGDGAERLQNGTRLNLESSGVIRRGDSGEWEVAWIGSLGAGASTELDWSTVARNRLHERWLVEPSLISQDRFCRELWERSFGERALVSIAELVELPEIAEYRVPLTDLLVSRQRTRGEVVLRRANVDREEFEQAYRRVARNQADTLSLGELFDVVAERLDLTRGEVRLIGVCREPVGLSQLNPEATQNRSATLVVVHLQLPTLPVAKPDRNTVYDVIQDAESRLRFNDEFENEMDDGGVESGRLLDSLN